MCFKPLEVTASGNSARPFFLERVTFFTSIKVGDEINSDKLNQVIGP